MAVTQNSYTGTGSQTTFSFTFPYLKASDIKASLDAVDTTAFTLPTATTLQFNTAPANGVKIKIFRETATDNLTATFYAGSAIKSEDLNENFTQNLYSTQEVGSRYISNLGGTMVGNFGLGEDADIVFEGASDNANETTITVADPTADRTITFPNVSGNVVTTGDTGTVTSTMLADGTIVAADLASNAVTTAKITDGNVTTAKLGADAVTGAKIADDQINSEHYVDASIDTAHIADSQITNAKMADNSVNTAELVDDAVTAAKLASNSVVSASIVDGTIVTGDIANNAITNAKMADDSVGAAELVDTSVGTAALASNAVTNAKMADNSVGTSELVNDSVTTVKIANSQVTTAKIADSNVTTAKINNDAVTSAKIVDNAVGNEHLQDDSVRTAEIQASAVTTVKIADSNVTTAKIAANAVTSAKIADDAVGSTELGDGVIDTVHVGAAQITTAKIADSNVTTAKITDANVTTAKIADDAITIGKIGCEQTTLSNSDSHIPTSGAVVDYVAAQIAPLGGLEVIATEIAFPNTQPSSGVVISISDAGGVVFNGSGTSTTGRTVGGSTVTINNAPSSLNSETLVAGVGLMVSSTGSSQIYNYHKILGKEDDIKQLSDDINDFNARYRVGSSNPTSALDAGDLFFNTSTQKLLVYNSTNSAWEEAQSIGNFFISTFSEAFDGSRTQFTLSNAPTNVQQVLLSLNGVVQKPGTAFTLSGSTVTLASAPASGTDFFAVVMGSTVNIGTPSNNTVTTAILQDDSVTTAKIAASNVTATELGANAVITSKIADDAVTAAKLASNAVVNASVDASAAIAGTKINPVNFSNVGINISSPNVQLHQHVSTSGTNSHQFTNTTTGTGSTDGFIFGLSGDEHVLLWNYENTPFRLATNSTERVRVTESGKVGIGTTSPSRTLHVSGDMLGNAFMLGDNTSPSSSIQAQIYRPADNQLAFATNGANERMRIDASGNVLIGKTVTAFTSDGLRLDGTGLITISRTSNSTTGGTANGASLSLCNPSNTDNNFSNIGFYKADGLVTSQINGITTNQSSRHGALAFLTHNGSVLTERMRIDSSGKIGVGVTTPTQRVSITSPSGQDSYFETNTLVNGGLLINVNGTQRGVFANDSAFSGTSTDIGIGAKGNMIFRTGTSGYTERMRIDTAGRVSIGTTDVTAHFNVHVNAAARVPQIINDTNNTSTSTHRLRFDTGGTEVGSIKSTNSATTYNTSSDYRLKENAVAISDGITRLKTLKPYRFNFKNNANKTLDGFFAHEVTAVPEAVDGVKDEVATQTHVDMGLAKEIGDPIYQSIDHSKLVPLLTSSLQEAIVKIETLETKVAALEAA